MSEKRKSVPKSPMDLIDCNLCTICNSLQMDASSKIDSPRKKPTCQSTTHKSTPTKLCTHMIDPQGRLFYQLTSIKKWSFEQAREAMGAYCEFLTLKIVHEDYIPTELSPTDIIDQVWHAHVLDTATYKVFNETYVVDDNFIHHDPLMAVDQTARQDRSKTTIDAFTLYFNYPFPAESKAWWYESAFFEVDYPVLLRGNINELYTRTVFLPRTSLISDVCRQLNMVHWEDYKVQSPDNKDCWNLDTPLSMFLSAKFIRILHPKQVARKSLPKSTIHIFSFDQTEFDFKVDLEDFGTAIRDLERVLEDKYHIPILDFRILYDGQRCASHDYFKNLDIKHGDTLDFMLAQCAC